MERSRTKSVTIAVIVTIAIIIAIAYRYSGKLSAPTTTSEQSFFTQAQKGAEISVKGTVVAMDNQLPVDGNASVDLQVSGKEIIKVIYDQGWGTCKNTTGQGREWNKGDGVSVFAKVMEVRPTVLSICENEKYYLRSDTPSSTGNEAPRVPTTEINLTGTVTVNQTDLLPVDGGAALTLKDASGKITQVSYLPGEAPCANTSISDLALSLKPGDIIQVFGKQTSPGLLSTCESGRYYIKKLSN